MASSSVKSTLTHAQNHHDATIWTILDRDTFHTLLGQLRFHDEKTEQQATNSPRKQQQQRRTGSKDPIHKFLHTAVDEYGLEWKREYPMVTSSAWTGVDAFQLPRLASQAVEYLRSMAGRYATVKELSDKNEDINQFENQIKTALLNVFDSRVGELRYINRQAATNTICSSEDGSTRTLEDFDWSARLLLSSQSMAEMHDPRVLLRLDMREPHSKDLECKTLELDYDSLRRLVEECDNIMASV